MKSVHCNFKYGIAFENEHSIPVIFHMLNEICTKKSTSPDFSNTNRAENEQTPKAFHETHFLRYRNRHSRDFHLHLLQSFSLLRLQSCEIPPHRLLRELPPRNSSVFPLRPLDDGIRARLVEERHGVPLAEVILPNHARRLHPVEGGLEAIVAPAHQHVPNITHDLSRRGLDLCPLVTDAELGRRLATRTDLEPGLTRALEEKRDEVPIHVCPCAVVAFRDGHAGVDLEVVQQAKHGLALRARDVVRLDEVVLVEPEAPREADHELLAHALSLPHEVQTRILESREDGVGDPETFHVRAELQLVALLAVGLAGGGPDLGVLFPARVLGGEGDGGFCFVGESEE